jgi:hypothetical protein
MAVKRTARVGIVALAGIVALLAYLRDPPWLIDLTSGLSAWEVAEDGTRYRWTAGRSSFFVPSDVEVIELRVRAVRSATDWPISATVALDDRGFPPVTLPHDEWTTIRFPVTDGTTRNVRRIDIKLDRVRSENRGIQLGEVTLHRRAR